MARTIEIVIAAKNLVGRGLDGAKRSFKQFGSAVRKRINDIGKSIFSMRSAMAGVAAVAAGVGAALRQAFKLETMEQQFKILLGNMKAAKARMEELKEFSAGTPFQLGDIATASRQLHAFSGGALGGVESLKMVGDAAAVANKEIGEVAFWVGRAYSAVKEGKPFGEAAMRLQELTILSGEARGKMEDLQKAGATNAEVWAVLEEEMQKAEGAMEAQAQTGAGLFSTLKDNWTLAVAEFGQAFADSAKGGMTDLIEKLQELAADGSIKIFAERMVGAMNVVGAVIKPIVKIINGAMLAIRAMGAAAGAISLRGFDVEAFEAGAFGQTADQQARRELAAEKKKSDAKKKASKEESDEKKRQAADLAAAEKRNAERDAKENAEKAMKEQAKKDAAAAKAADALMKEEAKAMADAEKKEKDRKKKIADLGKKIQDAELAQKIQNDQRIARDAEDAMLSAERDAEDLEFARLNPRAARKAKVEGKRLFEESERLEKRAQAARQRLREGRTLSRFDKELVKEFAARQRAEAEAERAQNARDNLEEARRQREIKQLAAIEQMKQDLQETLRQK